MYLRLFQFSLRDMASNWLERLPARSITIWEDLTTRFLGQFFPPGRTAKLRNDILMFQQHHGESLSEAWTQPLVESQGAQPTEVAKLNKGKELIVLNVEEKKEGIIAVEDDSDEDDKKPLSKRFKISTLPAIEKLIPLSSFVPEHLQKSVKDFTNQLFGTTSSKFSPTPPREPTPLRDPSKGKEVAVIKEQVNKLVPFQEKGGSNPKMPNIKSFITPEELLSQDKIEEQLREFKRLADLKAKKEK
ncbi:retrovirus-related pol polyprotein from transposon TNT 1-94 [Tanacetum coccineum]|uniref:Retrovirus-related pol polyprotein from transposon TNT 1-94 n=1 Tax=Tanacetum coccineum TaxID=301880 RepID=A0ABQ5C6T7_9ASTR